MGCVISEEPQLICSVEQLLRDNYIGSQIA